MAAPERHLPAAEQPERRHGVSDRRAETNTSRFRVIDSDRRDGGTHWLFHPVWDAQREMLSSYFLIPHLSGAGRRFRDHCFDGRSGPEESCLALDLEGIDVSERALLGLRRQGKRAMICITLHLASLADQRSRQQIQARLSACDAWLGRHRVIRIAGSGLSRHRLGEVIDDLRLRVPQVVLSVASDDPDIGGLSETGATAIGFSCPDHATEEASTPAETTLLARFRALADSVRSHKIPCYVEGRIRPLLASEFRRAGADYIVSPLIWKPQPQPDAARHWPSSLLPAA